jgi:orotate phosphoribosyltransferase-like protein
MRTFSLFFMMSQKEKIKELAKKGMKKKEIEQELHVLYGASSLKSTAIYKYIAETKFSPDALEEHDKPGPDIDLQLLNIVQ